MQDMGISGFKHSSNSCTWDSSYNTFNLLILSTSIFHHLRSRYATWSNYLLSQNVTREKCRGESDWVCQVTEKRKSHSTENSKINYLYFHPTSNHPLPQLGGKAVVHWGVMLDACQAEVSWFLGRFKTIFLNYNSSWPGYID